MEFQKEKKRSFSEYKCNAHDHKSSNYSDSQYTSKRNNSIERVK